MKPSRDSQEAADIFLHVAARLRQEEHERAERSRLSEVRFQEAKQARADAEQARISFLNARGLQGAERRKQKILIQCEGVINDLRDAQREAVRARNEETGKKAGERPMPRKVGVTPKQSSS